MSFENEDLYNEIKKLKEEVNLLKNENQLSLYKLLLECSPDIILQVDADCNVVVAHIQGHSIDMLDSFRGKNVFEIVTPALFGKLKEVLGIVFRTGETVVYESEGEISGSYRYHLNHVSAIKNNSGEISYAYFVCREITNQKVVTTQALDNEQKLTALFESSSQIISLYDKERNFIWFNRAAYDKSIFLFGKHIKIGDPIDSYLKEENRAVFNVNFKKALNGESVSYNREYVYEGKMLFLHMMLQPVYQNGEFVGVLLISNNDTDRKEYEMRLEVANKELMQQNEQLNQYSYIISHNLRAPIVTLLGLTSIFNQIKSNSAESDEVVAHITKSANHLDTVIKDLNNVLAVSDQKSIMTFVDLDAEFDTVRFLLKNEIDQSKAVIEYDFSKCTVVHSIKSYIHSILYNLLSNAVKYRKQNVIPVIIVKIYTDDSEFLCIEFSDNGIGVDLDKFKDKIFGFYKRFHSHIEGKGLGLHLIKKQVDALGGRIEVDSIVGKGTTFRVLLPV